MTKLTALFLLCLTITPSLSLEPVPFSINTKKWSHVLDDHFISITVNPTDLLQGKVYGLAMNSTMAILKGLAPAYVRIGSADTAKYTFKRNRYPSDMVKPEDEYTVTETHWMVFNEVAQSAGLDVIVCLNAAHRVEGTKKWDTRNSLELISFSDSQGYNLTWQLGYEVQGGDDLSGIQFGKDLNRLRTILNAFPRYQQAKLIGPDIRVIHKKEEIDFWNDMLVEAGPTLDAVTWHPRWPQPSKMKVSDNSDLGYEFPTDYLEWDKAQLNKILQKSVFKNPVWIGETKRESTGTFAEGLMWARRLVLAAKSGIEVVMKQPNLMDISHPKPEYWIALLHKRLLGKSVLETRSVTNNTDLNVISHCTNPHYWSDKPEKLQDGPVTVYGVNMGGLEQKIQIKGTWSGKSQLLFQYVLTSGSDPDSVFSQMTYLNGEPLMMTDDGMLPDIIPRIKKLEKGLTMKLPPYSIGFWVVPDAKVKICQIQPQNIPTINIETLTPSSSSKSAPNLQNIRDINQFIVDKLTNPESESEEVPEVKIEAASSESSEKDLSLLSKENVLPRVARRIRQVKPIDELNQELKTIMQETEEFLTKPDTVKTLNLKMNLPKATPSMEHRIQTIAEGISDAIKTTNQEHEFNKFLEDSGLKKDFGSLLMNDRRYNAPGMRNMPPYFIPQNEEIAIKRLRRSLLDRDAPSQEENTENIDQQTSRALKFAKKISLVRDEEEENRNKKQDLIIPHNPDLKGLEERYKSIVQSKIQDGKRKIDYIKRKIMQDDTEIPHKVKQPEAVNDIQEEIIKKEIELLEKTEETVADILKSQKKRQETFEDIIFDELNDVKGERITALKEMHRNNRKKENSIVKRQVQTPLSRPLFKTVEYIEKNFNLEPESVRKIKRSLEEKMGEILRNYDTKKSLETKKRLITQKEDRKIPLKKSLRDEERKNEEYEERKRSHERTDDDHVTKERPKEKNVIRKPPLSKLHHSTKSIRKPDSPPKEPSYRTRKTEEAKGRQEEDENDSFEMFNQKKLEVPVKKTERRRPTVEKPEVKSLKNIKKDSKSLKKEETSKSENYENERKTKETEEKQESVENERNEKEKEEKKAKTPEEVIPLKNDKSRRENMLKQITSMVDHMNSMERNGDRLKRMDEDEGISEEFESDRRSRKVKRRPRKADAMEIQSVIREQELAGKPETLATEAPVTTSTPESRLNKLRKRIRPNRRNKNKKANLEKEEENKGTVEEETKSKRHLAGFDRPLLEIEKKKILKPKIKKFFPKLTRHGNELPSKEKEKEVSEVFQTPVETPKITEPEATILKQNEELVKDIEEIIEEKIFLGQDSKISKEKLETNGKESLGKKDTETDFSGETPTPTEGYIIVEPTIDTDAEKKLTTESVQLVMAEDPALKEKENKSDVKKEELVKESQSEVEKSSSEEHEDENDDTVQTTKSDESGENDESDEDVQLTKTETEKENVGLEVTNQDKNEPKRLETSEQKKDSSEIVEKPVFLFTDLSPEESKNSESLGKEVTQVIVEDKEEDDKLLPKMKETEGNLRKRRATFLPNQGKDSEDEEEDYSSEERIQKFKQMVYKKSPAKKVLKNEVRPSSGMGMGADEFIRMAGSTVRVMFDDVIPEAYGQTKSKIQNMGIPEYIKEFGKIVQQMKNLDQIFLNIGEAAVKGYIRGNRKEKGPYIQVISRKKRSAGEENMMTDLTEVETTEEPSSEENPQMTEFIKQEPLTTDSSVLKVTPGSNSEQATTEDITGSINYATTSTEETIVATKRRDHRSRGQPGEKYRSDVRQIHDGETSNTANTDNSEKKTKEKTSKTPILTQDGSKTSEEEPLFDLKSLASPIKAIKNQIPKMAKQIQPYLERSDKTSFIKDNELVRKISPQMSDEFHEKISPWIKTTKDFIQQALTTLQRQRELSEILARESINDMIDRELTTKSIEKRDVSKPAEAELPVNHMKHRDSTRKRETQQKFSDEILIRHLRGLQPGVYVVPTEEMTNIRSEQIMNEAKQKSGQPNVVTLNIYYDKKNQETTAKVADSETQTLEQGINQDVATYFQNNKVWNTAGSQYDQTSQYAAPVASIPDPLANPMVASVPSIQTSPIYGIEPRIADLPNSRLIQYPSPAYHYPPVSRYPSIVPNPQSVYSPVYYLPPENRFIPQPPGTKRQWREFKARSSAMPVSPNFNTGWNIQYETVPGSVRSSIKPLSASSYNKNFKLFADKKRSVGDFKMDPSWSETALPFWKFFSTSSDTKKTEKEPTESGEKGEAKSAESDSLEELFAENRKRAKEADEKKPKSNSVETVTEEEDNKEEEEKSRKRRSIGDDSTNQLPMKTEARKIQKRSYPYHIEFKDHDILPEWFGTYQEIGNSLDYLPPHVRRSHIVSTPWSEEDEELQAILDADDQLTLVDLDDSDDYYYSNDNTLEHLRRYPRSTEQFDSNMIKSNMIYKMPMDSDHVKPKTLGMTGIKKLTDEDSSLELVTKSEDKTMQPETTKKQETPETSTRPKKLEQTSTQQPQVKQQQQILNGTQIPQNGTLLQGRNPNDDTFYYFFKYAYDSLVKVMKSMTEFF